MAEQINKDRLNELLGIQEGQTFEDYMNEAAPPMDETQAVIDQTTQFLEEAKNKVQEMEGEFKGNMEVIDTAKSQIQQSLETDGSASVRIDNLINVDAAFKSIEDLVDTSKNMIVNVYNIISSCDVLDSETVGAAASLIGETRQLIAEYTSLYKQRIKFFDNVKLEMIKQQNRERLLQMKYDLDQKKWNDQHPAQPIEAMDVTGATTQAGMSTDDMMKLLREAEEEDDILNEEVE